MIVRCGLIVSQEKLNLRIKNPKIVYYTNTLAWNDDNFMINFESFRHKSRHGHFCGVSKNDFEWWMNVWSFQFSKLSLSARFVFTPNSHSFLMMAHHLSFLFGIYTYCAIACVRMCICFIRWCVCARLRRFFFIVRIIIMLVYMLKVDVSINMNILRIWIHFNIKMTQESFDSFAYRS